MSPEMSRWAARIAAGFALCLVGLAVYAIVEPVKLFGYDNAALKRSLKDEADLPGAGKCEPHGEVWRCYLETDVGSGYGWAYRLEADSDGCWTAIPIRYGKPPISPEQRRLEACVDLTDIIL